MKRIFFALSTILFFVCTSQQVFGQQVDSVMSAYSEQFPVERIHIHFDKTVYNKEETIWYKVYLLTGGELSGTSKNVYVEWYDTTGRMIKQTVAPLFQSSAKGSFELPAGYAGNFIHVKAYTRWMLNDDPAFAYQKELAINTSPITQTRKPAVVARTKVETFPEGGFLVQGLTSRVAFKATNQYGNPVLIKGFLVNDKNKSLDSLVVMHDGMGSFMLTPQAGEHYKLNWTDENGRTGTTPIEVSKTQGACMQVNATNDKAIVQVERTGNMPDNFKQLNLLVHLDQKLYYKVLLKYTDKLLQQAAIPIEEMPTGILQFSLFTSDWIPVAERILFVNNHNHEFNAKLVPQLVTLEKRGKNVIDIQVSDTAFANMSIAVTDANVSGTDANSIYSDFLLSSDIKGKIYNPAYYLKSDADSVTANLDLVMLTNGWRRFDWDKIRAGILPVLKYPAETDFLKLTGKVLGAKNISAAAPLMLNVIVVGKDSSKLFMFVPVQKDGSFEDKSLFFYDTARIFYSFNGNSKLTDITQVQFENGLLRQTLKTTQYGYRDPLANWSDSLSRQRMNYYLDQQEQLKKRMSAATLEEVIVKSKARSITNLQLMEQKYTSGLFSGGDGYSFDLTDDPFAVSSMNILNYLQGKVAGLTISGSGAQATLSWRGATPEMYVNEMKSDLDMVQGISVSDIAFIKVFRPPFFGSAGGGSGGAISIYTKKGSDARKASPNSKGLENTVLGGYSRFKEFYSPSYEKPGENIELDIRTTLYWNPFVLTNKKNPRVRIQFYNNDISKKLQVVLEGINSDGKMTRVVKILE
jgi:hypothetical protein